MSQALHTERLFMKHLVKTLRAVGVGVASLYALALDSNLGPSQRPECSSQVLLIVTRLVTTLR
ncbi:hypothetical protein E2C01_093679 [Portunus trituberculatus]|uniref:Uncharacterized protein n=1 Tax=Portunus trituberculatus TaxID=210409 RepID=A0A5B7K136_PORTR|nr:hypothetical protein [Portunus trituberculatus]